LMHTAGSFHETNRITWENLAIIFAPHFTDDLGLYPAEDLLGLTQFTNQLRPMLEYFIAHPNTGIPFKERYANKLEHLANTRYSVIEKLTSKIKKMNHGHAKIKEEIRLISRSEDAVSTHAAQQSGVSSSSSNSVRIQLGIFGNNSSSSAYLIEEQEEGEVTENEYSGLDSAKLT
ncbi:TPA: Dot/Icm T4SS effector MavB, partial [Legionella pneumophila]|nr:hypothetical protein [Legionella pneumophila]